MMWCFAITILCLIKELIAVLYIKSLCSVCCWD